MSTPAKHIEFRIPISPNEAFFSQLRLFNYALRRLGSSPYRDARILIVVGDRCDIDEVRDKNRWSEDFNVVWERLPDEIWDEFGMWGTANWRLNIPVGEADIIILSDADTVLLRDIDPLLSDFPATEAAIRGHMAYRPPPSLQGTLAPDARSSGFWPWLFEVFRIPWPATTYSYSIDPSKQWAAAPAYFNLGFIALNPKAMSFFDAEIADITRWVNKLTGSWMRCQIAMTIIAYRARMNIATLSAAYNAGNEIAHLALNDLTASDIRVLHYLQSDEIDRSTLLLPTLIDEFLARPLLNPANLALQNLLRNFRECLR
jgi:hypothetical protein